MQRRQYSMKLITIFSVLCLLVLPNCTSDKSKKKQQAVDLEDFLSEDEIFDDIDKAKKIFYSLQGRHKYLLLVGQSVLCWMYQIVVRNL